GGHGYYPSWLFADGFRTSGRRAALAPEGGGMKRFLLVVLASLASTLGQAVDPVAPAVPAAALATAPLKYTLDGLKPLTFAHYNVADRPGIRQFLKFQNGQGTHYVVVEEVKGQPALHELDGLRQFMGREDIRCTVELTCKVKAFCTGAAPATTDCHNMYY